MTAAPEFEPATARVLADPADLDGLVGLAAGDPAAAGTARWRDCGVLDAGGRLHPAVAGALAAMRDPAGTLALRARGRRAEGWVVDELAVLLMPPEPDGRRALVRLHPSLLPDALARAVDLGPRPVPGASRPAEDLGTELEVRRRWRLAVAGAGPDGPVDGRALEVADTADGLYVLDADAATARPVSAREVWRLVVRLLVHSRTDGLAPLPADADLPGPRG